MYEDIEDCLRLGDEPERTQHERSKFEQNCRVMMTQHMIGNYSHLAGV